MFPSSIPTWTPPDPNQTLDQNNHTARHASYEENITALATKVGVDSSAVPSSHEYRITELEAGAGGNYSVSDEAVTGTQNGSNMVFTTDQAYIAGSLEVFINGLKQTRGTHFTETTPASGTFTLDSAPVADDIIRVNYMFASEVGTIDADTVDGYHASGLLSAAAAAADIAIAAAKEALYPVGSIYTNATDGTNPATLLGFGTWAVFGAGKFVVGLDTGDTDFDTAGETGGAKTHDHGLSDDKAWAQVLVSSTTVFGAFSTSPEWTYTRNNSGGGSATNTQTNATPLMGDTDEASSLPPYTVIYMWRRTA